MKIIVNIGPLTGFGSLSYYVAPKLREIRKAYLSGITPEIEFDLTGIDKKMRISALAAFLSISKTLRNFIGKPIPITIHWNPQVLGFLADISFLDLVNEFDIFKWQDGIIGGFQRGNTNPKTKILYYEYSGSIDFDTNDSLTELKKMVYKDVADKLIFYTRSVLGSFDTRVVRDIEDSIIELAINSVIHGKSSVFIAFQETANGVTAAICDSGIGFPKSLKNTIGTTAENISHGQGVLMGAFLRNASELGLNKVINDVLNIKSFSVADIDEDEGHVIISSYDTEIRLQKRNWLNAKSFFGNYKREETQQYIPNLEEVLGPAYDSNAGRDNYKSGYWRKSDDYLVGTRVSFEILKKNKR